MSRPIEYTTVQARDVRQYDFLRGDQGERLSVYGAQRVRGGVTLTIGGPEVGPPIERRYDASELIEGEVS